MSDSEDLVAHMRPVQSAERDLRDLALIWQTVECSAAIGCPEEVAPILPTLIDTRRRFASLQGQLIEQMVLENRAEVGDDLGAKAQGAIDILVRNLYERTADVGFLATDDVIRAYCAATPEVRSVEAAAMLRRLAEYQAKYSVYDDVLLVAPSGAVLARLDAAATTHSTRDALIADALNARGYVERFGPSDLAADDQPALLYAHRIDAGDGRALGVLVLRFRFADEMRRIFEAVVDDTQRLVLMLVDEAHRVIATSDPAHIAIGSRLPALDAGKVALASFAGREYLGACCASHGYQGYGGPRWRAVAMVTLSTAFRQRAGVSDEAVPLDNAALLAVQTEAEAINRELRRVLWNGRVMIGDDAAEGLRLKAVLQQVSATGGRTRSRVKQAIHDIYRVSLSRARQQAQELARMAADVMDRNLYERANDCRWWALSPVLQQRMAEPPSAAGTQAMQAVLGHINGLYTVYSQLVAFDHTGRIRAVSVADTADRWVGRAVPAPWLQRLQSLSTSQRYAVSAFEPTELHDHGATYVYLAAVRAGPNNAIAGGVAIVFNAARELGAILRDLLGERAGFAAFIDAEDVLLATTDAPLAAQAAAALGGDGAVVELGGAHYACARVLAPGYREFKVDDGYANGVGAIVGLRLGASERRRLNFSDFDLVPSATAKSPGRDRPLEVAVFQVGAMRYALPAAAVLEAMPQQALMRTPSLGGATVGMLDVGGGAQSRLVRVVCARQLFGVTYPARQSDGVVLVLRPADGGSPQIGLRVDDVLSVLEVGAASVHPAPQGYGGLTSWVVSMIDCVAVGPDGSEPALVQLLSCERLLADVTPEKTPARAQQRIATAGDAVTP